MRRYKLYQVGCLLLQMLNSTIALYYECIGGNYEHNQCWSPNQWAK